MNPPSSEQVQYALDRLTQIAQTKRERVFAAAPAHSLAHETVVALQTAGRRPTLLPRHLLIRHIAAAVAAGHGSVALNDLVRVPHKITLAHRQWENAAKEREAQVAQVGVRHQSLVDGLLLGTVTPADAITQLEAFSPSAGAIEAKVKKVKPAKKAAAEPELGEGDAGASDKAGPAPKAEKPAAKKAAPAKKAPSKDLL